MRVLITLEKGARPEEAASLLTEAAAENETIIVQGGSAAGLELELRNLLPERDVVSVQTRAVVSAGEAPARPAGVLDLTSIRLLLKSGAVVICVCADPVAIGAGGDLRQADSPVDLESMAKLLARRLEADLFVA